MAEQQKNQNSTQTLFDPQAEIRRLENVIFEGWKDYPTEKQQADVTAGAVGGIVWIKTHGTEPPESAIPTAEQIIRWYNKRLVEAVNRSPVEGAAFLQKHRWGGGVAGIIANQKRWLEARANGGKQRHPLAEMIQAWQKAATAVQVTKAADVSYPVALRLPFGAVSAQELEADKDYHLPVFEPFDSQIMLDLGDERATQLARHLPIRSWLTGWNVPGKTKGGGHGGRVPIWLRLFLEALVCADRFQGNRIVYYELEYLYKLMYGESARWDKVRVRQLRTMIDIASRAVVVLKDGGEVLPVNFKYFEGLERDSKIFVEIAAVRDAKNGALTAIEDLRDAYRSSNATLQAYLSSSEYLDREWTRNKRLLYETVPVKNADGVILDHLGNPIMIKNGKPVIEEKESEKKESEAKEKGTPLKNLKNASKEIVELVMREPNPKFAPDPIAVDELVGVCWADNSIPISQRRKYRSRALEIWGKLPIIDLEEIGQDAAIIRPSQKHRNTYRAIKKAIKKAKKKARE